MKKIKERKKKAEARDKEATTYGLYFGWSPEECNPKRLQEGMEKLRETLDKDEKDELERKFGLPSDWTGRILREENSNA